MVFVMKFQAAAMGRADIPEAEREDFSLYVDEFQNFSTESFGTILSEARKYRLSLVLANQFMTQLTDQIREAIIGNIGTVISGRIGITDAEILVKKFSPTFDAEDMTKLPNFQTIASVMINNVPSAAFSMSLAPPMGQSNPQLKDAIKNLSAAKYGRPRAEVERDIFARLGSGDAARKAKMEELKKAQQERLAAMQSRSASQSPSVPITAPQGGAVVPTPAEKSTGSSFLDDWLAKRQTSGGSAPKAPSPVQTAQKQPAVPTPSVNSPDSTSAKSEPSRQPDRKESVAKQQNPVEIKTETVQKKDVGATNDKLHIRESHKNDTDDGVSVKLR
jgi:hypothetical protein